MNHSTRRIRKSNSPPNRARAKNVAGDSLKQKPGAIANPIEHVGGAAARQIIGEPAQAGDIDPPTRRFACGQRGDSL
jgi:hypothetical protein